MNDMLWMSMYRHSFNNIRNMFHVLVGNRKDSIAGGLHYVLRHFKFLTRSGDGNLPRSTAIYVESKSMTKYMPRLLAKYPSTHQPISLEGAIGRRQALRAF